MRLTESAEVPVLRRLATVRARISLVMLIMVLVPTLLAGAIGYWTASQIIISEKIRSVGTIADTKKELLLFRLYRQRERLQEFLSVIAAECSRKGRINETCAHSLLKSFLSTESALDAALILPGGKTVSEDGDVKSLEAQSPRQPGQIAQFSPRLEERPNYVMSATNHGLMLIARFGTKMLDEIFTSPPGLGATGETFLADSEGKFLTTPKYHSEHSSGSPIDATPMLTCLAHHDGETLAGDYRPVPVIHGYRYLPEIGGGCLMAHIQQGEAFAPLAKMRNELAILVLIFATVVMLISYLVANTFAKQFTKPLAKLVNRILAAQSGDLDSPVPTEGPKEIAVLGKGFSALTSQLKKNIQAREDFVAIVSHDLKNPISSLGIALTIMERHLDNPTSDLVPQMMRNISIMRQIISKMTELINAVLNLTAIRAGRFILQYQSCDLNALILSTAETIRPLASDRDLKLNIKVPAEPLFADIDPNRLSQVLSNFLGNALKFTPRGGAINLELTDIDDKIRLCVSDTGPGIPPDILDRLFERFAQGQPSQGDFSVGLGLYIAKEIILAHGGRIWAESAIGHGAKFYFEIPRHP